MIREVYEYLRGIPNNPIEMTLQDIKDDLGLSLGTSGIGTCEALLEKAGAIERLDSRQNSAGIRIDSDMNTLVDLLPRDARTRRHVLRGLEQLVSSFRGERVLFQPQKFADDLGMKWDAVKRSIRELTKLPAISYIPPFRGRAVHVIDKNKPFHKLNIDFAELDRRQKSEHEKLQRVISLATTKRCRQLEILEYFGDPDRKRCQNCDNCSSMPKTKLMETGQSTPASNACLYAAQVALSGTARTHGRLGKTLIAQMLTGSANKKVKQLGLDRLSTFGLLKQLRQSDVTQLMEFMISQGFIDQIETTKFRPTVKISDSGKSLMAGELQADMPSMMPDLLVRTFAARLRGKTPHVSPDQADSAEPSDDLIDNTSDNQPTDDREVEEPQPSYDPQATSDAPFIEFEPATGSDSPAKLNFDSGEMDDQGDHTVPATHQDAEPSVITQRNVSAETRVTRPNFYWTWRLLADGYSLAEVLQVRNMDRETAIEHSLRAIEDKLPVQKEWILSETTEIFLNQLVEQHPNQRAAQLLNRLPAGVTSQELLFFLGCRSNVAQTSSSD